MRRKKYNWYDKQIQLRKFYGKLQKGNDITQVTVTNHTDDIRKVTLWGANACSPITDPLFLDGTISETIDVEKQPQDIAYNPANNLFYVVNQLSDSVSAISASGVLIATIDLCKVVNQNGGGTVGERLRSSSSSRVTSKNKLPGTISPSSIAINAKIDSPQYGMIAVACSVSDEVVFINTDNTIDSRESVGVRPIDVVHNIVDDCYYVANLVSGTISKICVNRRVNNLPNIEEARTIGVNQDNGDLYIHSTKNGEINIYDVQGSLKGTAGSVQSGIVSFAYHPIKKRVYMTLNESNTVSELDSVTFRVLTKINVGNDPVSIAFNSNDGLLYVANRGDQNITRLDIKNQIVDTIDPGSFGIGLAISSTKDIIALSNSANDTVTIFGEQKGPTVTVNEEYFEDREDFQHNPTLINHLKIVASGDSRINALQLIESSVSGKESVKTISLSNHQSPQNFGNISEVFDIGGDLIDGHIRWCFKINPKQTVTFLIYHKQFEMYNVLPEKSRISTGVQMSKGIPASWLDNYQNEPPDESDY